jgi:hypothetical protein
MHLANEKKLEPSRIYRFAGPADRLANASAQETSVILYAYLATIQKVRDGCHHFCAAMRA